MDQRFLRNEMLWGREGQERLAAAHVILFGLGGVGSYTADCLARSGIGELTLVDSDTVSVTNINRQLEALSSTVGQPKAEAVAARIRDINPAAVLHPMQATYDAAHRDLFFPEGCRYDYIVDAIDLVSCKLDLAETARRLSIPLIMALGTGNKLDPSRLEVTDISKTSMCPLARIMRKELRKRGIPKLKVVYSKEPPMTPLDDMTISCRTNCICPPDTARKCTQRRQVPGSNAFVPSVAGLILAGEVLKDLTGWKSAQ